MRNVYWSFGGGGRSIIQKFDSPKVYGSFPHTSTDVVLIFTFLLYG